MRVPPTLALLLVLLTALAGCASRSPGPTGTPRGTGSASLVPVSAPSSAATNATAQPSPATLNLTKDPVDIQDSGDLAQGASKDWTWHVAPGYSSFTVELDVDGPQGAPEYVATGLGYRLVGGDPPQAVKDVQAAGGTGADLAVQPSGCVLCYDGADQPNQAGQWSLHFEAQQGAASWTVHVQVAY